MNYIKIINENKQVGKIYHFTTFINAVRIVSEDTIKKGMAAKGVSFTRDKSFGNAKRYGLSHGDENKYNPVGICFVVDGDKLSNKFKIGPYSYYGSEEKDLYDISDRSQDESEELVYANQIDNFRDYIIEILVYKNKYPDLAAQEQLSIKLNGEYGNKDEWINFNFNEYLKLLKAESASPIKIVG